MAANDTMPIRIPISMDAQQVDVDAVKASASFGKMRTALRSVKADVADAGKSFEQLGREQEQLEARKSSLTKRLEELTAAYAQGGQAADVDAEAQAKLAQQIASVENQLRKVDVLMEKNSLAQYSQDVSKLDAEINKLTQETQAEVAQLQIAGQATEATSKAREGAIKLAQLQSQRLDALREAMQKATEREGEGSRAVAELGRRYNEAAAELTKMTDELNKTNQALEEQGNAATNALAGMAGTEVAINRAGQALTNNLTRPIINFGKSALQAAVDTEAMEQSFDAVFKKSADGARKWSQSTSESMNVSEYRLRENMSTMKNLLVGMDVDFQQHGEMITEAMVRMYDMAAMMDTDVATAFSKYSAALTGSSRPLMEYGIVVNEAMTKQYAYKNGIAEAGATLTEQQKVLARHGAAMEQSAHMVGRWNEEANTTAGMMRSNTERLDELQRKFGEKLIPVLEKLLNIVEPIIDALGKMDEKQLQMIVTLGFVVAALGPVMQLLGYMKQLKVATEFSSMGTAAKGLTSVFKSTLIPGLKEVLAVIAAVAAVAEGVKWFWNQGTPDQQRILTDRINAMAAANQAAFATNRFNPSNWYAGGTGYHQGGRALVGERGPEIVDLPQGSRVYPNDQSERMMGGTTIILEVKWDQVRDLQHLVETAKNAQRLARQGG